MALSRFTSLIYFGVAAADANEMQLNCIEDRQRSIAAVFLASVLFEIDAFIAKHEGSQVEVIDWGRLQSRIKEFKQTEFETESGRVGLWSVVTRLRHKSMFHVDPSAYSGAMRNHRISGTDPGIILRRAPDDTWSDQLSHFSLSHYQLTDLIAYWSAVDSGKSLENVEAVFGTFWKLLRTAISGFAIEAEDQIARYFRRHHVVSKVVLNDDLR